MDTQPTPRQRPTVMFNMLRSHEDDLREAETHRRSVSDGRYGWPTIFVYRWTPADGVRRASTCPPRLSVESERDPTNPHRTAPYTIELLDPSMLSLYEALVAVGRLREPGHTGAANVEPIDNRRAPKEG
jgi:hypothetical protein